MTNPEMYDSIADQYWASKLLPFRRYIERYTLFRLLGDMEGRSVVDLACGEGIYARAFMRLGAKKVTGVDISKEMVALAEATERAEPLGRRYAVGDVAEFTPDAPADIVTAVYLWNYASTREQLEDFCRACRRALRPGGRLIGMNDNMRRPPRPEVGDAFAKYGFERSCRFPPREGDVIRYRLTVAAGEVFTFENYYLKPATYEAAAEAAGLVDFRWVDVELDPAERDNPHWRDFMTHAPLTAFTARRAE